MCLRPVRYFVSNPQEKMDDTPRLCHTYIVETDLLAWCLMWDVDENGRLRLNVTLDLPSVLMPPLSPSHRTLILPQSPRAPVSSLDP